MTKIILLLLLSLTLSEKIKQDMQPPRFNPNKEKLVQLLNQPYQTFSYVFNDINFEISSKLYAQKGKVPYSDVYNESAYEQGLKDCQLYPTTLQLYEHQYFEMVSEPISYATLRQNITQWLYVLDEYGQVSSYQIDDIKNYEGAQKYNGYQIKMHKRVKLPQTIASKAQLNSDYIRMVVFNQSLYFITPSSLVLFDGVNFTPVKGYQNINDTIIITAGTFSDNKQYLWVSCTKQVHIYEISDRQNIKFAYKVADKIQGIISDIVYHNNFFYVLSANSIYVLNHEKTTKKYDIEGSCYNLQLFKSTLHAVCTYEGIEYISEYYVDGYVLTVNRYYNDNQVQGISNVHYLGQGKMLLTGDFQFLITSYSVNRNTLMEVGHSTLSFLYSFNYGYNVLDLPPLSTKTTTTLIIFYSYGFKLITFKQLPPELYCSKPGDYSFLALFNTTHCPFIQDENNSTYGNLQVVCQTSYPLQLTVKEPSLERKTGNLILFVILLLIALVTFLVIGFLIKKFRRSNYSIQTILRKIKKFKSVSSQELKKI